MISRYIIQWYGLLFCLSVGTISNALAIRGIKPENGSTSHTKYVLFSFSPKYIDNEYDLIVALADDPEFNSPTIQRTFRKPAVILKHGFDFGKSYIWRFRQNSVEREDANWSSIYEFDIVELPDSVRDSFEITTLEEDRMQPGITISATFDITWGIEHNSEIVWFIPGRLLSQTGQWDVSQLKDGTFSAIKRRSVRVFDINNNNLWTTADYDNIPQRAHHEAYPKSDGNFMFLIQDFRWIHRTEEDSVLWAADKILEVNRTGEIIWNWNSWNYISQIDHDSLTLARTPPGGMFDWLHGNSCSLDERERAIYYSMRNISRIVKIDYPSGDIVWSMGQPAPSGHVNLGENVGFYRQHAPFPLPNGNLLFYDNHNVPPREYSRALELEIVFGREQPAQVVWEHRHTFSSYKGDADRLENGNTLIASGNEGTVYEVTPDGDTVWQIKPTIASTSYRAERITSLYPLVFAVSGPPDSSEVYARNSFVVFRLDNIGDLEQSFHYTCKDREGWFHDERGFLTVPPRRSVRIAVVGYVPEVDIWDEVSLIVEPVVSPASAETLAVYVYPGEPRDVGKRDILPGEFTIGQSHPNPFNRSTTFKLMLLKQAHVGVRIFDLSGRQVWHERPHLMPMGKHKMNWDAKTSTGDSVPAGNYMMRIDLEDKRFYRQVTYLP